MIAVLLRIANGIVCLRHPILTAKFMKRLRRLPNVSYPRDQPDRMLWRKIFDRNPLYRLMLDKLTVRALARARCPGLQTVETVWVGADAETIPEALLRPGFVIKANNGADRNIFTNATTTRAAVESSVRKWLRRPYGVGRGEWGYGRIQPAVLVDKLILPPPGGELLELNCQVAMGRCFIVSAIQNVKKPNVRRALFDRDGTRFAFPTSNATRGRTVGDLPADFRLPAAFAAAVRHAEAIGQDCDYVRADFICSGEALHFSECTVFHSSGYDVFPDGVERLFAANWRLRNSWFMRQPQHGWRGLYAALYRAALQADRSTGEAWGASKARK